MGIILYLITGKIETQPELTEVETHDLPFFKLSLFFGLVAPLLFNQRSYIKFVFSKKFTKVDEILTADLTLCNVKSTVKILSIFVAFSENLNFMSRPYENSLADFRTRAILKVCFFLG